MDEMLLDEIFAEDDSILDDTGCLDEFYLSDEDDILEDAYEDDEDSMLDLNENYDDLVTEAWSEPMSLNTSQLNASMTSEEPVPKATAESSKPSLETSSSRQSSTQDALAKVEDLFERIVDSLLNDEKSLSVVIRSKSAKQNSRISFPGKTSQEAWRFSTLASALRLLVDTDHIQPFLCESWN